MGSRKDAVDLERGLSFIHRPLVFSGRVVVVLDSRHRRTKKQLRDERVAATRQLSPW